MPAQIEDEPFPSASERGEVTWENKWNTEPAFVHLPVSDSSSHPTKTERSPGWNQVRKHEHCTQVSTSKDKGTKGDLANGKEPNQSVRVCLSQRTHFEILPFLPIHYQFKSAISECWCLTAQENGASTNKYVTSNWGGMIHWLNMARPKPAQEGCQAHANIYFSWAEISLLFCSPNEHRILSIGPGICATAMWDIQNSKNWFPSVSHVLKTDTCQFYWHEICIKV